MTFFDRFRGVVHLTSVVALGLAASMALAACSSETETNTDTTTEQSPAPVLGEYDDRIQLVEGTPYSLLAENGDTVSLEITGYDDEKSNAVLTVTPEDDSGEEITLAHGDVVELGEASWRVSEMGFSDSMPGSVTLTREE